MVTDENHIPIETAAGHTWESTLVLSTIGRMMTDGLDVQTIFAAAKARGAIDVRIVIEGHEMPAAPFIKQLAREFDHQVANAARELVTDQISARLSGLYDRLTEIETMTRDAAREAFPNGDHDD